MTHWRLRLLEAVLSTALAAMLVTLVFILAGCTLFEQAQKERRLLMEPEQLPANKAIFAAAYTSAIKAAHEEPTPENIARYVDAGNALNARHCSEWLSRVTLARRGLVLSDHNLGVVSALTTTIAGLAQWNPMSVAALGAAQVAIQGFSSNIQTDVLGAPAEYQAQGTVLRLQGECADKALADAPRLLFSQAYGRLEACSRLCSFDAASDAATRALSNIAR